MQLLPPWSGRTQTNWLVTDYQLCDSKRCSVIMSLCLIGFSVYPIKPFSFFPLSSQHQLRKHERPVPHVASHARLPDAQRSRGHSWTYGWAADTRHVPKAFMILDWLIPTTVYVWCPPPQIHSLWTWMWHHLSEHPFLFLGFDFVLMCLRIRWFLSHSACLSCRCSSGHAPVYRTNQFHTAGDDL